jgi:hypothetical protein
MLITPTPPGQARIYGATADLAPRERARALRVSVDLLYQRPAPSTRLADVTVSARGERVQVRAWSRRFAAADYEVFAAVFTPRLIALWQEARRLADLAPQVHQALPQSALLALRYRAESQRLTVRLRTAEQAGRARLELRLAPHEPLRVDWQPCATKLFETAAVSRRLGRPELSDLAALLEPALRASLGHLLAILPSDQLFALRA